MDAIRGGEEQVVMTREAYDLLMSEIRGLKEQVRLVDQHAAMMDMELYEMQERLMDAIYRRVS